MDAEQTAQKLVDWMRECVREAGAEGVVFGMSGGVDSSVVAVLAKRAFPDASLGLLMPCHSEPADAQDAMEVVRQFDLATEEVPLTQAFDTLLSALRAPARPAHETPVAVANIKPRLRMIALYYFANSLNYLVAGTGNKSEAAVGYYTKYGDGGVDILPLANLTKARVVELAQHLGIPKRITTKPPSAGLWKGQTDEAEMGVTYGDIEDYLSGRPVEPGVKERIRQMESASRHKSGLPLTPDF